MEVEISQEQVEQIFTKHLYDLFDWGPNHHISDGHVWGTGQWSFDSKNPERIRLATERDFTMEDFMKTLRVIYLEDMAGIEN